MTSDNRRTPLTRRGLLGAGGAAAAATTIGAVLPGRASAAVPSRRWRGRPGTSGVGLRWLGNNAWQVTFGSTTILIDPWLTRFKTGTYTPAGSDPNTPLTIDPARIDPYISQAQLILVCHSHFDHMSDVPYIAPKTGATVVATESAHNMLAALGTPRSLFCTVRGGEYLEYGGFTLEVFRSLHSMTGATRQVPFPGTRPGFAPPKPTTISELVEGDTVAYRITIGGTFRIVVLSTANFIESELAGLRPDLAIVASGGSTIHDYVPRLMAALDYPAWVLPSHWDDFDYPLDQPAIDNGGLVPLRDAVTAASPKSAFVQLEHGQTFTP